MLESAELMIYQVPVDGRQTAMSGLSVAIVIGRNGLVGRLAPDRASSSFLRSCPVSTTARYEGRQTAMSVAPSPS